MEFSPEERMDMLAEEGEEPVNPAMARPTPAMLAQLNEGEPMSPRMKVTPGMAQELDEEKKRQSIGETIGVGLIPTAEDMEDSVEEAVAEAPDPQAAMEDGETMARGLEKDPEEKQRLEEKAARDPDSLTPAQKVALIALSLGAGVIASQATGDMMGEDATTGFLTLAAGASEGAAKYAAEQREDTKAARAAEATRRKEQLALDKQTRDRLDKLQERANKQEMDLTKVHMGNPITKDSIKLKASYGKIAATDDTAAGDLALIFNYMKMLDPGSVVREGEFATAQNAAGVPDRVRNLYNNWKSGQRLNPKQRQDFRTQARKILNTQMREQAKFDELIGSRAERQGLRRENSYLDIFGTAQKEGRTYKGAPVLDVSQAKTAKVGSYIWHDGKVHKKVNDKELEPVGE